MYRPIPQTPTHLRVFNACLLSFMLLMAPLASVGAATHRVTQPPSSTNTKLTANEKLEASLFEPAAAPLVPAITATKTDTFPSHPSSQAEPGDTITYDVNIQNTGTDATGVNFTDTIDPNTTLVPGSLKVSPLAFADTYTAEKDVVLNVGAPGVLTNDTGLPAPTAVPIAGGATTGGGTVTLNADGSFNYTPASGFTGADSFTYTATNGLTPNDTAIVTINVDVRPTVTSTTPTNAATNQATSTDITINFSEAVDATTNSFTIECPAPGSLQPFAVSGSGTSAIVLNPTADLPAGTTCTVTVIANQISDTDTNDPPDIMSSNFVFSFTTDAPPSVTSTTPTNGATNVATNSNITVNFSESVSLGATPVTISCATSGAHTFVVSASPNTAFTINPNVDFAGGEICTVTVLAAQVADTDAGDPPDNMAANFVFSFTTDAAPTVTSTTPTNGATNQTTNADITLNFSESVNLGATPVTISCTVSGAHTFVVSASPNTTFTVNPNVDFVGGETCTVTVLAAQVTDTDTGDPPDNMAANFVFSFTIDAAPTVNSTTPTNGATQVANNANVSITFSESVNLGATPVTISCATSGAHTSVVSAGPNTVFTVNPDTDFANGELCTVTVLAAQVTDNDANDPPDNMAANFVFSFTVDNPPTVTTTTPTNGATGVAANTNITVNFSESVNATTSSFQIECPSPGNTQAFTLSASPSNTFTLDPTSNLPVGVICTVTVFAAQITDTDAGDPPDNMAANHVFSFSIPPDAVADARSATGNIRIQTAGRSNFSLLTNDIGPGITVTAFDATSVLGGNVSVAANGTFSYNPPPGYEGSDTFNYTISNLAGSDTATVTITISGMIWFIDDSASACTTVSAAAGCGRLTNPLSTMAAFEAVNGNADVPASNIYNPAANDHIFIYSGSYTAPLTLEAGQRVIGQGATSSLQTLSGVTPATDSDSLPSTGGTAPSITSGGNGFNVVSNNQLYGLAFSNTTGTAINSTANVGTMIIGDVTINNSGSAGAGIVIDDGGTNITVIGTNNTINTRSGVALQLGTTPASSGVGVSTPIGAAGVNFKSISAGNNDANADPVSGIILNNTGTVAGTNGGLNVPGTGTTDGSGGTIQNTTGRGASFISTRDVVLKNMTFTNAGTSDLDGTNGGLSTGDNLDTNAAIHLITVTNATLDNVDITGGAEQGINGNGVSDFNLLNSTITNVGNAADEDNIHFFNMSGTCAITSTTLTHTAGGGDDNLNLQTQSGTLNLTISGGSAVGVSGGVNQLGSGYLFGIRGTSNATITFTSASSTNNFSGGIVADAFDTAIMNLIVTNSTSSGNNDQLSVSAGDNSDVDLTVTGSTLSAPAAGDFLPISLTGSALDNGFVFDASITGNTITVGNGLASDGIVVNNAGGGAMNVLINGNTFDYSGSQRGILVQTGTDGAGAVNVTITDNDMDIKLDGANNAVNGILAQSAITSPTGNGASLCADIGGAGAASNTFTHSLGGVLAGGDIRVRQRNNGTVRLPGYVGGATDTAAVIAYLNGRNVEVSSSTATADSTGFAGGALCTQPNITAAIVPFKPENLNREFQVAHLSTALTGGVELSLADTIRDLVSAGASDKPITEAVTPTATVPVRSVGLVERPTSETVKVGLTANSFVAHTQPVSSTSFAAQARTAASPVRQGRYNQPVTTAVRNAPVASAHRATTPKKSQARSQAPEFRSHHARSTRTLTPSMSGETVNHTVGTLLAGKTVRIQFQVTVDTPFPGGTTKVSNQGTVTADGGISVDTDDPDVGGANDPTDTPVQAAADAVDDAYTSFKNTILSIAAPGVLANDTGTPTVTAIGGCADVTSPFNCTTTQGGTLIANTDGSFSYVPPFGGTFTGDDTFTYTATNATNSDTATVTITVSDTSTIFINEVLFDPPGTDAPNEYIELRGTPSATLPAGTYLVAIEGDAADDPGDVQTIINLSGLTFGTNGFLVLLQNGNTYTTTAGATVITSTTTGFGGLPGGIWSADSSATDIEDSSVTFMLIQTGAAPTLTDDIDANDDGAIDALVHNQWSLRDSISAMNGGALGRAYGAFSFRNAAGTGTGQGGEVIVPFIPSYVGRIGDSTGSTAADWVASGVLGGAAPNWTLGIATETEPATFAGKALNHIGTTNFENSPPVNTVPGPQATNEDVTLTFNAGNGNLISIADTDAGGASVQVTLTTTNGVSTLSGTTGLNFGCVGCSGDGTSDALMVFQGTITDINAALDGLAFTPTLNFNGAASLEIETDDLGNTGDGGAKTDTDTVNITVGALNDPPSFTIAGNPAAVNEDAGAQTVNTFATNISQGPGETGQTLTFNLSPTGTTGNLTFSSGPSINSTTGNLTYTASANTNGTASFNVTLSDNGGGTNTSGTQSFTITVNAVNDAPSFQIPSNPPAVGEDAGAQTVNGFATNFQPGPATATDEAGQTLVGYTVTQTASTGNLSFSSGPSIDNAGALTYTPTNNTSGTVTFNVVATDSGSGTAPNVNQSAAVSFTITVNGDNDAPVLDNTGNMTLTAINEDVADASNPGTLISAIISSAGGDRITDVDAGAVEGIAVIAANNANGTWQYSINNGTNWTAFGSPSATTARLLAANASTRVRFVPNANFNGSVAPGITFRAWDQFTGTNGGTANVSTNGGQTAFSTATETAAITVNPVNDQPTANAQAVATNEGVAKAITLTGSDVETAAGSLTFAVTVQPTNGVLSGTAPNLTYTPNADFSGADSFKFTVTDTGDGASAALKSAEATVSITVNGVNDAPVNTKPGTQTTPENTALTFSAGNGNLISIADVDAGSNPLQLTLTATNGTFSLNGTAGLAFTTGDGVADVTMTFTGTIANINAALNGLVFTPTAGFNGAASLQIVTNDQGNTGSGGAQSDTDTVNITVQAGGTLQFSSATFAVNENGGPATITITRTGGSAGTATVLFETSNGTAGASDYTTVSQTVTFVDGDTSETVNIPITNDTDNEADETVNLTLSNAGGSGTLGTPAAAVLTITNDDAVAFNFSQAAYVVAEDGLHIDITVNRTGDPAAAVSVDYATSDLFGLLPCTTANGNASDRCDYLPSLGTLNFAASETSRTFRVFVSDDVRVEGAELLTLTLSDPAGGVLGATSTATLTINDHVVAPGAPNPIDDPAFFIRMLYVDILSREPDTVGFNTWLATLNGCPNGGFGNTNTTCDRVHVAQGFFGSKEFGERGYFVYRFHDAGLGQRPTYKTFLRGMQQIGGGLSPADSDAAKMEFIEDFMASAEFQAIYTGLLVPAQANAFITKLEQTSGVSIPEPTRSQLVSNMANSTKTPAETLKAFMETTAVFDGFFNRGFVSMLYFGYLHRDPDTLGFDGWLQVVNQTGDYRQLTFGFIYSIEYRGRFGP